MVKKAVEHSHREVREVGLELLFAMYKKVAGRFYCSYLELLSA